MTEQKEEIAGMERDLNELREKRNAMERDLYSTEKDEKLDWRRETLISAFKKELKTLCDANDAVIERYRALVRLQACINARAVDTIHDKNASLSDKKVARERILVRGGSDDEVEYLLRNTFIHLSPFYR